MRYLSLLLLFCSSLYAKTGMFLEVGSHNFLKKDQPLIFKETSPAIVSLGYIYDFTPNLGTGLQVGYTEYQQQQLLLKGSTLSLKERTFEYLWSPVIINLGRFRFFTKIGSSRGYSKFFSANIIEKRSSVWQNVTGIGIDAFVTDTFSLSIAYFSHHPARKNSTYIPGALSTIRPYHQRFVYTLRYAFPSE